jgi:hypothetical protein
MNAGKLCHSPAGSSLNPPRLAVLGRKCRSVDHALCHEFGAIQQEPRKLVSHSSRFRRLPSRGALGSKWTWRGALGY